MKFCDELSNFSGGRLFSNGLRVRRMQVGLDLRKGTQRTSAYAVEMDEESDHVSGRQYTGSSVYCDIH